MKALLVQKSRIRSNVAKIRSRAENAEIYAVLKGDAYGLGLLETALILKEEGITRYALTDVEDAILLRKNGFQEEEILMLRSTSEAEYIEALAEYNLVGTIGSQDVALAMSGIAEKRKTVIEAHIKLDCGMGRFGFLPSEFEKIASTYKYMSGVALTGIYTHLPRAYDSEKITRAQIGVFVDIIEKLRAKGIEPGLVHAANSSALFQFDFCTFDAVRIGSAITGRIATKLNYGLQRVGVVVSTIAEIRWLPKGVTIGYGSVYKTPSPKRVAVIPVGYADGFCAEKGRDTYRFPQALRYSLSDIKRAFTRRNVYVSIGGSKARVLGHVGMLHTVVDVTKIDCAPGDAAVFDVNPLFAGSISRTYE
jgi:alanine racemase